ncbi:MAG: hypothetical protein II997_04990 [Clostridia bacterium]|nr:hypothetical protein [Clostridia bacterium]
MNFKFNVKGSSQGSSSNEFMDFFEPQKQVFAYSDFLDVFSKYFELGKEKNLSAIDYGEGQYVTICPEPITFMENFYDAQTTDASRKIFEELMESFKQIPLSETPDNGIWFNKTLNGINLRPGRSDPPVDVAAVELGDHSVHGMIVGRTGSGKSVFLNNLLFNMMTEYPPWELDLYLADFKKVELSRYMTCDFGSSPHVRACAATSEIRYVVSLLTYITECMRARENFLKKMGFTKIADLRNYYSEKNLVLPRVLLLVDEFQQMFLEATSREALMIETLLTTITKLGRATGFHLLFASQEMSGTLSGKAFANFKARFALPCDAEISTAILGNSAAADIFEKGVVIVNTKAGAKEDNIKYKVPFISDDVNSLTANDVSFYDYLKFLVTAAQKYEFSKVQKFYDEDAKENIAAVEDLRKNPAYVSQMNLIIKNSFEAYESLLLGRPVVFNSKKVDYETVFLERGKKKNISIICNKTEDAAYVTKLLAENFKTSIKRDHYVHYIVQKNPILESVYSLADDMGIPEENIDRYGESLEKYITRCECNKYLFAILQKYNDIASFLAAASKSIVKQYRIKAESVKKVDNGKVSEQINKLADQIDGYTPETFRKLLEPFDGGKTEQNLRDFCNHDNHNKTYQSYVDAFINYRIKKLPLADCIPMYVVWILGLENVESLSRQFLNSTTDSLFYNVLYIFCCATDDGVSDYIKQCDYIFINTPDERVYNRYKINYTQKNENSIAIDFKVRSAETERAFKKFHCTFKDYYVPFIDFDKF